MLKQEDLKRLAHTGLDRVPVRSGFFFFEGGGGFLQTVPAFSFGSLGINHDGGCVRGAHSHRHARRNSRPVVVRKVPCPCLPGTVLFSAKSEHVVSFLVLACIFDNF